MFEDVAVANAAATSGPLALTVQFARTLIMYQASEVTWSLQV